MTTTTYCPRCDAARKIIKDHRELSQELHLEKERLRTEMMAMSRTIKGLRTRLRSVKLAVELVPDKYDEMTPEELFGR